MAVEPICRQRAGRICCLLLAGFLPSFSALAEDFGSRAAVSAEDFYSASTFGGGRRAMLAHAARAAVSFDALRV